MVADAFRKKVGNYYLGRTLGEGTYAKVKYAQHAETGEAFAVKVIDKDELVNRNMLGQLKREITITKHLQHPNIVDLKEVLATKDKVYIVLELVPGGELFDKIVADGPLKEPDARKVFQQLLDAIDYCHRQGIVHRDLKPENVLIAADGTVKLSDFGLGALPDSARRGDGLLRTSCGTPNYIAPEVMAQRHYDGPAADIWSLGVLLYVITSGMLPFEEKNEALLYRRMAAAKFTLQPWFSAGLGDLLRYILQPDPSRRPTIDHLRKHPWVAQDYQPVQVAEPEPWSPLEEQDMFEANTQTLDMTERHDLAAKVRSGSSQPKQLRMNAFQLINAAFDLGAMFDAARGDVITRHTRFTCRASAPIALKAIEAHAKSMGGTCQRRGDCRTRLQFRLKRDLVVGVEIFILLPGLHLVAVTRFKGDSRDFYDFYKGILRDVQPALQVTETGASVTDSESGGIITMDPPRTPPPAAAVATAHG
eukprot:jgi/Botrbrau1/4349/Bobra.0232s0038.1